MSTTKHQTISLASQCRAALKIIAKEKSMAKKEAQDAAKLRADQGLSASDKEDLRAKNRSRRKDVARRFYLKNKEKVARKNAQYRKENPEMKAGFAAQWRSRRYGQTSRHDAKKAAECVRNLKSGLIGTCAYCRKEFPMKAMTIDHVLPLAKGGLHIAENLTLACRSCNSSKNDKILGEQWGNTTQPLGKTGTRGRDRTAATPERNTA